MTDIAPVSRSDARPVVLPRTGLLLLLRWRARIARNTFDQVLRREPLKIVGTVISVVLIWAGLYALLRATLVEVRSQVLEGIVATPLIFTFFFLALTGMLAFSGAILSYGGLFRRLESSYLLASPLHPRDVVIVKYIESLFLSSWSLLLLGIPLMLALAHTRYEPWSFYPLFVGLFVLFIPLPGALGLLLAWVIAMVAPKTPGRVVLILSTILLVIAAWYLWQIVDAPVTSEEWHGHFHDRVASIQHAMFPHTWVSNGISHALQGQTGPATFYLFVTLANGLFVSMIAVAIVTRGFVPAFTRVQTSGARAIRRSGSAIALLSEIIFFYLPRRQRLLAAKDLKTFFRDPLQWSQMAILFGLLALYVSRVRELWTGETEPRLQLLIAFLNLTAVCLILATFTSRFVFPLVSLEGQQLWLLGLLPLPRNRMILAKFLYALTITLLAAVAVMGVSVWRLELPRPVALAHVISSAAICIGLCGVSIGMGARVPSFTERNPARIAGGFGGTISLLVSVALVVVSLAGMGVMTLQAINRGYGDVFTLPMLVWLVVVVLVNVTAAALALAVGIRHFNRLQF